MKINKSLVSKILVAIILLSALTMLTGCTSNEGVNDGLNSISGGFFISLIGILSSILGAIASVFLGIISLIAGIFQIIGGLIASIF